MRDTLAERLKRDLTAGKFVTASSAAKQYGVSRAHARKTLSEMAAWGFADRAWVGGEVQYHGKQGVLDL